MAVRIALPRARVDGGEDIAGRCCAKRLRCDNDCGWMVTDLMVTTVIMIVIMMVIDWTVIRFCDAFIYIYI
jgi:hypothetical protein